MGGGGVEGEDGGGGGGAKLSYDSISLVGRRHRLLAHAPAPAAFDDVAVSDGRALPDLGLDSSDTMWPLLSWLLVGFPRTFHCLLRWIISPSLV